MAGFEVIDGKSEELFDRALAGCGGRFSLRKVGAAVGIKSDVDDRVLEDDFVEGKLGTEKRADFQAGDDAIGMGERDIGGRFASVYGDVADLHLKTEGNSVEAADFGAASGDALDFSDETAADQRLEGVGVDIDRQGERGKGRATNQEQQILPPAPAGGDG